MNSAAASELTLDLPPASSSVSVARHAVADWARDSGASVDDMALAVSEAVSNAVTHAFKGREDGTITVRGRHRSGRLIVAVTDNGVGMTRDLESPGLGMGISLISKLAGDVRFDSSAGGTTISMSFDANRREEQAR